MSDDLDAIRARRKKLEDDPGWMVDIDGHLAGGGPIYGVAAGDGWLLHGEPRDLVEFVANAPGDIAALLAEVDRLTAELAESREAYDAVCRSIGASLRRSAAE